MRKLALLVVVLLSGCGLFHRKPHPAPPTQFVVTGAPSGATLLVDGVQAGRVAEANDRTQVLPVSSGTHVLEVKVGDSITYRESAFVAPGEKRVIRVLSGFSQP